MLPISAPAFRSLSIAVYVVTTVALISACSRDPGEQPTTHNNLDAEIGALTTRMDQLERRGSEGMPGSDDSGERVPPGPIKSITFRSGTADDRLRIYWEDGRVSNLPCTLEQGTWACG